MKRLLLTFIIGVTIVPALAAQQRRTPPATQQQRPQQTVPQPRLQPNTAPPNAARPNAGRPPNDPVPNPVRPNATRPVEARTARQAAAPAQNPNNQVLQAFYLSEFQRQVGVNDEVTRRFRPILMDWLQQRREVIRRRNAAVDRLRQLMESGAGPSEISRQVNEVDQVEIQARDADRRLMTQADPLLTPAQQARFRLFHVDMEQRIRELVDQARQPANAQPIQPRQPARSIAPAREGRR
jgi:hypothetical protein